MKFLEIVEALQKEEKNQNKIILVKCGVFFVAIGKDAILLHETLGLNVTCIKPGICKVGIPITGCMKYTDRLEKLGYGYTLYDYNSKNKKVEVKYEYNGKANNETEKNTSCKECKYYQKQNPYDSIYIFDILEERKIKDKKLQWLTKEILYSNGIEKGLPIRKLY